MPDKIEPDFGAEPHGEADDIAGMEWWNHLDERERADWLRRAGSARAVDAWAAFKRSGQDEGRLL